MSEIVIHPNGSYTARQVAEFVFQKSYLWFSRNLTQLRDRDSFPEPISSIGQPRWSGASLLLWMQRKPDVSGEARRAEPDLTNVLDLRTARMLHKRRQA